MTCRWRFELVLIAVVAAASPAFGQDQPDRPSLSLEPIIARDLLAPADEPGAVWSPTWSLVDPQRPGAAEPSYRLVNGGSLATGARARLSVPLGDTTVFALTGKLSRRPQPGPPDLLPNVPALRRPDSGKVYGLGAERRIGPLEVSAAYQYSKLNAGQPASDYGPGLEGEKSHSLRATARIRFRH